MAAPIPRIQPALPNALHPIVIIELAFQLYIAAAQTYSLAVNAWKIRLATDAGAITHVERVIPDIQLPWVRRIRHGKKVHCWHELAVRARNLVSNVHDIFIGAN